MNALILAVALTAPPELIPLDVGLEVALASLVVVDVLQTSAALYHGARACDRCPAASEANPLLGRHPSPARLVGTAVAAVALHAAVAYVLPPGWREGWQMVALMTEAIVVSSNYVALGAVVALPW